MERFLDQLSQDQKTANSLEDAINKHDLFQYKNKSDYRHGTSGWLYWYIYLHSYFEYTKTEQVTPETLYAKYLIDFYDDAKFDPEFYSILSNKDELCSRIESRFVTTSNIKNKGTDILPITLFGIQEANEKNVLFLKNGNTRFSCNHIDGYHRLFSSILFQAEHIKFTIGQP